VRAEVIHGDCLDVMRGMADASVDAVICDPPYGIGFMGKAWDGAAIVEAARHDVATRKSLGPHSESRPGRATARSASAFGSKATQAGSYDFTLKGNAAFQVWCEAWAAEAIRVAKPGAALLAFGGTRTFHRLACAIEDSGWRIYDCLSWMYGQGFPKHRTHLKPAWEPIVLASKKGTRFVNVEGCRLGVSSSDAAAMNRCNTPGSGRFKRNEWAGGGWPAKATPLDTGAGRWPANVVLDEEAARAVDEMSGESAAKPGRTGTKGGNGGALGAFAGSTASAVGTWPADPGGGASRFFYTAKASRADRDEEMLRDGGSGALRDGGRTGPRGNHHPTVKPTDLMRWLCRLVTPPGGTVLDPFCGSGSTGVAANAEGFDFIGIEREAEYVEIARRRIANVAPLFAGSAE